MTPLDNTSPAARPHSPYSGIVLLGASLVMVIACVLSVFTSQRLQRLLVGSAPTPSPTVPLATLPSLDMGRSALNSIAMISSDDGWIVGENSGYALILRYRGGRWLPQPVTVAGSSLQAVAFADAQHGWAIGSHALTDSPATLSSEPLILRYQQGRWSRVKPSIAIPGTLTKIRLASADEWWALTYRGESSSPALVHFRRGAWSMLPLPADLDDVHGLSVAGPDDVWLGTIGGVVHVHGGIIERSLQAINGNLLAVDLRTIRDIWAVGLAFCGVQPSTSPVCDQRIAIYHYDGDVWTPSATDARGMLNAVASVGAGEVWAVGSAMIKIPSSLIMHYHNGEWQQYATSFAMDLQALSMTGPTDGWAVGYAQSADRTGNLPKLLHCHDGTWTQATLG